jgi:dTDP-4-dehydrorhamnose reductase
MSGMSGGQSIQKRVLIVGGSGFVGRNFVDYFAPRYQVTATYLSGVPAADAGSSISWTKLDARLASSVTDAVGKSRPDIVIYTAGKKNVSWCESHQTEADAVNGEGAANVARACHRAGCRMIYLSTDLVFDGFRGGYREDEAPSSPTAYGRTKLHGEQWACSECPDAAICRSGGIYGNRSPLLGWLAKQLRSGAKVEAYTDVRNTPTYAVNLAEMLDVIMNLSKGGIFHTAGSEAVNRLEFFQACARTFGLPEHLLAPTQGGNERDRLLLQPDASLNTEATRVKLGIPFDSVTSGMRRLIESGALF